MCYFRPRYPFQDDCLYIPRKDELELVRMEEEKVSQEKGTQEKIEANSQQNKMYEHQENKKSDPELNNEFEHQENINYDPQPTKEFEPQQNKEFEPQEKQKNTADFSRISELLIDSLSTTEVNLSNVKKNVAIFKPVIDDFMFKLESIIKIVDIVKENERRKLGTPQAQVASLKTSKDSIDEILELLQGPVFQKVLRQLIVGLLVNDSHVTNLHRST